MTSNAAIQKKQNSLILAKQVQILPSYTEIKIPFRSKLGVLPATAHGWLNCFKGRERFARWSAISGYNTKPTTDRRWSPGNGAALPIGDYLLGQPEPWGTDIWLNLQPQFKTERSGLGIHHCNPGSGCLCIPNRTDLEAIAAWVKATKINKLTVQN